MSSILKEFACGNICLESQRITHSARSRQIIQQLVDNEKKLFSILDEQEKEIFQTFMELQMEVGSLLNIDTFIYGYRLGVLMTMEVFNGRDSLIID